MAVRKAERADSALEDDARPDSTGAAVPLRVSRMLQKGKRDAAKP
jgi:hypothetical protein